MEFDNSFEVPLAPDQAWNVLMDIPRIARCMPGAELTEVVDAQNYRGKISVRLGPVSLAFAGRVQIDGLDEANHSAHVKAQGNDAKGRGSANATARFHIEPTGEGSRVMIHTDLMLAGAVAQYGRGVGIIQGTAAQIVGQFAANLRKELAQEPPPQPAAAPAAALGAAASVAEQADPAAAPAAAAAPEAAPARPISGLALIARVIWQQIRALFGGRPS
jgi:carbon monoxide dehydrogenase subunit G